MEFHGSSRCFSAGWIIGCQMGGSYTFCACSAICLSRMSSAYPQARATEPASKGLDRFAYDTRADCRCQ